MGNQEEKKSKSAHQRWAEFRFGVVGGLLSAPPPAGELAHELKRLAAKLWQHPVTGEPKRFGRSTIERWHGMAGSQESTNPIDVLRKKVRKDVGSHPSMDDRLAMKLRTQYGLYPHWSAKLHRDNLKADEEKSNIGLVIPSLATLKRYMRDTGLKRRKRPRTRDDGTLTEGAALAAARLLSREIRSYENEYVGGLWHLDFHACSRKVLMENGTFVTPVALGVIDDHSRLITHLQWYLSESTENLVHGFSQAVMRRRLCRSLMTDNGSAMTSEEFTSGLTRLSVIHDLTLPYSPYQNGKQEAFWGRLEGQFVAMLSRMKDLTLKRLNNLTFAWVEHEYNAVVHEETGAIPRQRYAEWKDVLRPAPRAMALQAAFRCETTRTQRHSDGTISIDGRRFEVPSQFRHMTQFRVRYASWDLSYVSLTDPRTGAELCRIYPQDKAKNASGIRRRLAPLVPVPLESTAGLDSDAPETPPLLEKLIALQAQSGPPLYVPKTNEQREVSPEPAPSDESTPNPIEQENKPWI
jgi:transposase InsO family protein